MPSIFAEAIPMLSNAGAFFLEKPRLEGEKNAILVPRNGLNCYVVAQAGANRIVHFEVLTISARRERSQRGSNPFEWKA